LVADRWLCDALTAAAAAHSQSFLASLMAHNADTTVAAPEQTLSLVATVAEHLARNRPASAEFNGLADSMAEAPPALAEAALGGFVRGWPRDYRLELSGEAEVSLGQLLARVSPAAKGQLLRLASLWGSGGLQQYATQIVESLAATIEDGKAPLEERVQSARQLVELQPDRGEVVARVLSPVTPQAPPELATGLIEALSASSSSAVAAQLVERMPQLTPAAKQAAIRTLLARAETTMAFLSAVEQGKAHLDDLALDQKQALSAHPSRDIRRRATQLLRAGGGLPNPDRQKVLDELLPVAQKQGDPHAGKELFKKHCSKCHTHSGEGQRIGPDLTGMAVHPKAELMIHVFDPSRSVEGNFRTYTVITADGVVLSGMLAGESRTAIELIDAEAKRHTLLREDLEELVASSKSLMPEGFEKQMTPAEITDLMEFLTTRGKYTPLDFRKVATITSVRGMFYSEDAQAERLVFPDWLPKTVEGVPFHLVDPQEGRVPNVILLYGPQGKNPPQMPRSVRLPVNQPAKAIHLLGGVSGWGFPLGERGSVSMIVRLHYADGATEDHELKNGVHFADYIRRVDVPESELAFMLRGQQVRYLAVQPRRTEAIREVEFVKGADRTAPLVVAATVEGP
jgi:putative heme-binding domain-containing protein